MGSELTYLIPLFGYVKLEQIAVAIL